MHANILMLHIVHNVLQISDLMEWMNEYLNISGESFFFFLIIVGKVFIDYWKMLEYYLNMYCKCICIILF